VETVAFYKEIIHAIKASGGEAFKLCFQCGLCDVVCPWNRVPKDGKQHLNPNRHLAFGRFVTEKRMNPDPNHSRDRHLVFITKSVYRHLDPTLNFVPSRYPFVMTACLSI